MSGREQLQQIHEANSKWMRNYRALRLAHRYQALYVAHTGKFLSFSECCS
jgi:hypothetical protein